MSLSGHTPAVTNADIPIEIQSFEAGTSIPV
jgi:hypothetical protein